MSEGNGEVRKFTLKLKSVPFILETQEGEMECTVTELVGEDRDNFLTKMATKYKIGADGKPGAIKDFTGFQSDLLCKCVYDNTRTLFPIAAIKRWPASLQSELFEIAQKLSGFGDQKKVEEEAKND